MNLYEHTIIARQDTSPSEIKQLTEKYSKIVEKNEGEIVKTENWGLLNLSYLIRKNKKGSYIHFKIKGKGNIIKELEKNEAIYKYLKDKHPELVDDEYFRPHDTAVIEIPQSSPKGSILRTESAFDLMERVKRVATDWVAAGHKSGSNTHNVSATISLKKEDWDKAGEWMWKNRDSYNGLSVLPYDGGTYTQAPFEDITKKKFEELVKLLQDVNLENVMRDHDVVLNTTGPFFKFGVPILKSAIKCKCHYFDICDDWEPTIEMLNLNEEAFKNNVTAIIGLGASPGISNLLGLKAINELDSVDSIITGWDMSSAKPEDESSQAGTNAAMEHALQQISGEIKVYKDDAYKMTKPLEKIDIHYPGRGSYNAYVFGHPEAVTFPHHFNNLKESLNACHGSNQSNIYIIKILRWLVDTKLISFKRGAAILEWLERKIGTPSIEKQIKGLPAIYGLAAGTKNQKKATVAVTLSEDELTNTWGMGAITGFPLAFGLKLLLENKIDQKGVFAPEGGAINPDDFFPLLTDYPLTVSKSWED